MAKSPLIRLGTRGSPLALAQTLEVRRRLGQAHPDLAASDAIETVVIKTTGDEIQDRTLAEIGGKGMFTKEIEEALLAGAIDVAVHSMKDVPTWLPEGLALAAILPREDPRDALFAKRGASLADLPPGTVVGTASLRRQAQVLLARPDLSVVPLRGNVQTRLRKLAEGQVGATLLAVAGLRRLGEAARITAVLSPEEMLPAVAQGAIGLETRADDGPVLARLEAINDGASQRRVAAERACLEVLDGSCRTPIAALAELDQAGAGLRLRALVAMPDGGRVHRVERRGAASEAEALGREVGEALRAAAGSEFFAALAGL
jgi:hydroxymethylbilane synthase